MIINFKRYFREYSFSRLSNCPCRHPLAVAGLLGLSSGIFIPRVLAETIGSQDGQNITLNDGDNLVADRLVHDTLYGITNPYGKAGTINLGNHSTISVANAPSGWGVLMNASDSVLTANGVTIDVTTGSGKAIELSANNVTADLGTGSRIKVEGTGGATDSSNAIGIWMNKASSLRAERLSISTKGAYGTGLHIADHGSSADLGTGSTIVTDGHLSYGVYVGGLSGSADNGPARFTAAGLTIESQGYCSYGINIQKYSIVNLKTAAINTRGAYSIGIWNWGELTADALAISTEGEGANGLEVRSGGIANIGADSHIAVAQSGGIVATGADAIVNFSGTANQRNTLISGGSYGASAQTTGSSVNLENTDITIDRNGSLGLGLWALSGGTITGNNIAVNGAAGTVGAYAMTNSQIDLTGDLTINMASADQLALSTQHNDGFTASRINASGTLLINGGVNSAGGQINLRMEPGSVWTGGAWSDNINGGYLNAALTDSTWNVTGSSNLGRLTLAHSLIDLSAASSVDDFSTLSVADLSGSGTFVLRTDIVGEGDGVNNAGDKVVVTGNSAGSYFLSFINRGSLATTGNEVLTVVETADGQATFRPLSQVELGGYLYDVRKNGTDWELYSSGTYHPTPAGPDTLPDADRRIVPDVPTDSDTPASPDTSTDADAPAIPDVSPDTGPNRDSGGNASPQITTTADAGGNFLNVGYLLNYAETQTLMQRMGDLHQSDLPGNAWLRGFGGKFNAFASGKLSHFDMRYSGYQFGFDKRIEPETPLHVGVFMGLTRGTPGYRSGDGTVQSHHAGLYGTWMSSNGFYIDGIARLSRQKNQFSVLDSQSSRVAGTSSAAGVGVSFEMGRRLSLNQPGNGYYLEPQAQFAWSHQGGSDIRASNGLKIDLGSYHSAIGRAGALFGYEVTSRNAQVNAWFKTGLVREFAGNTGYKLNGSPEQHSFKGSGWNNGLGVSTQWNKQHTLYLEVDASTGSQFNQRQANAGYRFSF